MEPIKWKADKVIDIHVHYRNREPVEHWWNILDNAGYDKLCIVGGKNGGNLDRKADRPGTVYVFAMLDQKEDKIKDGDGAYLVDELDKLMDMGYDGIKMMDGKPHMRWTWQPRGVDDPYFNDYWKRAEEIQVPITIHCVDPIDYWNPEKPNNYTDLGTQEEFFRQPLEVMERHPDLNISFAHFFFMGPDLPRLAALFDTYPKMHVDMAMGVEFMYYMSDDVEASRDFMIKYSDRVILGTDISDHNALKHGVAKAEMIRMFLESDEEFPNYVQKAMGNYDTVGSNGRKTFRGLDLPQEALDNICWKNFERFCAKTPKEVDQASLQIPEDADL